MNGSSERRSWKQAPGWMKLLLLVSLIGNAAVVGILCGSMLQEKQRPDEPGLNRMQTRILYMVPEAKREAARTILLTRQGEIEAAHDAQVAAQSEMMAALKAEPFSADRLAAALAARQDASGKVWGIGFEQIADVAKALTPTERAAFADSMEEQYRRWQERRQQRSR